MPEQPVPFFSVVDASFMPVLDSVLVRSPNKALRRYVVSDPRDMPGRRVVVCPAGSLVPVGVIAAYGSNQAKLDAVRNPSPDGLVRVKPQVIGGVRSHGILVPLDDPRVAPIVRATEMHARNPDQPGRTAAALLSAAFAPKPVEQPKTLTTAQVVSVAVILLALIDAFAAAVEGIVKVLGDESEPCAK